MCAGVHNTNTANAKARLKTLSLPEAESRAAAVLSPVRPVSSDSGVEEVFGDPPPHGVPVYKVIGASANLREATEGPVVQIGEDVIEDVIWQLRQQHGDPLRLPPAPKL